MVDNRLLHCKSVLVVCLSNNVISSTRDTDLARRMEEKGQMENMTGLDLVRFLLIDIPYTILFE